MGALPSQSSGTLGFHSRHGLGGEIGVRAVCSRVCARRIRSAPSSADMRGWACGSEVALRAVRRGAIPHGLRFEAEGRRGLFFSGFGLARLRKGAARIRVAEKAETNLGSAGWTARATGGLCGAFWPRSFSKRLLRGLVVIACSCLGFEMGLVHLDLYGVILVGTINGRGREGKGVVGTCVTKAACDPVGYVVAGGQDSAPALRGESLQCEAADSDTQSPRSFARLGKQVSRKDAKYAEGFYSGNPFRAKTQRRKVMI
jgi:hypothetical protein